MIKLYDWHYEKVPRLGTVIFSPAALKNLYKAGVGPETLLRVLEKGTNRKAPSGSAVAGYRDLGGIRLEFKSWRRMNVDPKYRELEDSALVCVNGYRVK